MSGNAVWTLAVIVFLNSLFVAGIAVALFMLHRKLTQLTEMAQPLATKVNDTLGKMETMTAAAPGLAAPDP